MVPLNYLRNRNIHTLIFDGAIIRQKILKINLHFKEQVCNEILDIKTENQWAMKQQKTEQGNTVARQHKCS